MKRVIVVILLISVTVFILFRVVREHVRNDLLAPVVQPAQAPTPTIVIDPLRQTDTSLFVPSWTDQSTPAGGYNQYIFFGVIPTSAGIEMTSTQKDITAFEQAVPNGKQTLLTLQMQDTDVNSAILENKTLQQKVIQETVSLAQSNNFSGVVLDLEIGGIPFDPLIDEINGFTKALDTQVKAQHLTFEVALYGDTFYRLRPFDVKTIAANSDMILIMAYDFHKAGSDPGPNFPLGGQNTYGYDMSKMSDDFLQAVPNQKLGVIFGLFGYDWPVDKNGNATGNGQPLTDIQIQNEFLTNCSFKVCQIKRDLLSSETEIQYTDNNNQKHIVWFEDLQSVTAKEHYLKNRGIGNFSFWANSYF